MSNRRGAGAPTANGPIKGPTSTASNTKAVFDKLNRIREQIDELAKDNTGRQGYEQLQQELQSKSKEVDETRQQAEAAREQYDRTIAELQSKLEEEKKLNQHLHDSHRDWTVAWSADTKRLQLESAELSTAKQELERMQDELVTATEDRDNWRHKYSQLRNDFKDGQKRLEKLETANGIKKLDLEKKKLELKQKEEELQKSRKTLEKLNDNLGLLPLDKNKMEEAFEELASKFHKLVWNTFSNDQDVPDNALLISVSGTVLPRIPRVATNSQAARYMRCALAEALIAETLSTDVFQDAYLGGPQGTEDFSPLVTAMRRLLRDGRHGMQATIIRCQLVKVCQESDTASRVASKASQSVCQILNPWLGDTKTHPFAHELNGLFFEAVGLWQTVQRTRTHAKVEMSLEEDLWKYEIDSYREYDESQQPGQDPRSSMTLEFPGTGPVAVLFPQIRAINDLPQQPAGDDLIYPGHALFPAQSAFTAAWAERHAQPTTPNLRRSSTTDRRRGSRTERQDGQAEAQKPTSRRMSTSSRDGAQPKSVLGMTSDSERGSVLSVMGRADPTASVSSTRSRRSGSGARGGG